MKKLEKILLSLLVVSIILNIAQYVIKDVENNQKDKRILHGTFMSVQREDEPNELYRQTLFVIDTEKNKYYISQGEPPYEEGTYKISRDYDNVIFLENKDGEKDMISIDPRTKEFYYFLDRDRDEVRLFRKHDESLTFTGQVVETK